MSFHFIPLSIPDVVMVETTRHVDSRGFFAETFRRQLFHRELGADFVQDNLARSKRGVLRGLHFQLDPSAQGKLVQVVRGEVFDVTVDLRRRSSSFGKWVGVALSGGSGRSLWIPPGFAHGYLVTSDGADVAYKVTAEYEPTLDRGIRWDDPDIGIDWPLTGPIVSEKDGGLPLLSEVTHLFD